jgi:hypothetical protein
MIVTFQGASDDLVEINGAPGADEFNVYEQSGYYMGTWQVLGEHIWLMVDAYYDGTWSFAVRQPQEDWKLPEDLMILTTTNETINGYTTMLWIDTKEEPVSIKKVKR